MMNARDFFISVARMRRAQRGRSDSTVFRREARELEKQVDAEIERTMRVLAENGDPLAEILKYSE